MNVLLYNGPGTSATAIKHLSHTLRTLLPTYSVKHVDAYTLLNEPWQPYTSLLVFPGGRDKPFQSALHGIPNRLIREYVASGGKYLGLCAGGYYGCSKIEFELNNPDYEIVEPRELNFFKGICRGAAFRGFNYNDESGAKAIDVSVHIHNKETVSTVYWNGGGTFVDADSVDGVLVLARYLDRLDVDGGNAAVVQMNVGKGTAILTGIHPEYQGKYLTPFPEISGYQELIDRLINADISRNRLMTDILFRLGLQASKCATELPSLTPIYLTAVDRYKTAVLIDRFKRQCQNSEELHDNSDTFVLCLPDSCDAVLSDERLVVVPAIEYPDMPHFNISLYFETLKNSILPQQTFGQVVLYSQVASSTQTILEKNIKFSSLFDPGTAFIASQQLSARGRGTNTWVSPPGVLAQSFILRHDPSKSSVTFIQYLVSLAMVETIRFQKQDFDVRLKWPNDIFAPLGNGYTKVGGVLVTSRFDGKIFDLVIGCGLNVYKNEGIHSLNSLLKPVNAQRVTQGKSEYPEYQMEILLAAFFSTFEAMYELFIKTGSFDVFHGQYYRYWLHSGQIVNIEGTRAEILGLDSNGLLCCQQVDENAPRTGQKWALEPDGNSFDMLKGLIRRKR